MKDFIYILELEAEFCQIIIKSDKNAYVFLIFQCYKSKMTCMQNLGDIKTS